MGVVPGFEFDLFISYAHDNDVDGWVSNFRDDLEKQLCQQLPARPTIWFDRSGLRGQALDAGIADAVYRSAVLVSVVSSRYLRSDYCVPKELLPFAQHQHPAFPLVVDTFKRIVVAAYDAEPDCPRASWPEVLHDAPCVGFCERDGNGDRQLYGRRSSRRQYETRLGRVVDHLKAVLERLRQGPRGEAVAAPPDLRVPVSRPRMAWQKRWNRPLVYLRYFEVAPQLASGIAEHIRQRQCDVTFLERHAGEPTLDAYLRRSDAEVLVFGCHVTDWARDEWLRCLDIARDGRPRRLGVLANGNCVDELGISSDFVVPLRLSASGAVEGLDRLLEGLP